MITGGKGGGNTITGLIYEGKVDLATFLNKQNGYLVYNSEVYYNGELIARLFKKHKLYKYLEENGVDWRKHLSKKLLPDDCIYVIINNTVFIIEVKHQQVAGSVDEKLQTCDFKKKQYIKLIIPASRIPAAIILYRVSWSPLLFHMKYSAGNRKTKSRAYITYPSPTLCSCPISSMPIPNSTIV